MKAVLFRSVERFDAFRQILANADIDVQVLDFSEHGWIDYDYSDVDLVIYYPSFEYSSSHPLALSLVQDNLLFIKRSFPHLQCYPDPALIKYYNDKYRQFLFLSTHDYPIPETIPLLSRESVDRAADRLGFPLVLKNRYGAGGGTVYRVTDAKELLSYYRMSRLDLWHPGGLKFFARMLSRRIFYYHLIKARNLAYPFFSPPLLAQKFVDIQRDLKTVTGDLKVVEAHWRHQADASMWKMNIDGGGTGVWGAVPEEALELSARLATDLQARWLNIDLIESEGRFLISEFSPVWHHYAYKEKASFEYRDDYNIDVPLEISLNLEQIIVDSLVAAVAAARVVPPERGCPSDHER